MNKLSNGTFTNVTLEPGTEQYCPTGSIPRFAYGADIKDMKCDGKSKSLFKTDWYIQERDFILPLRMEALSLIWKQILQRSSAWVSYFFRFF